MRTSSVRQPAQKAGDLLLCNAPDCGASNDEVSACGADEAIQQVCSEARQRGEGTMCDPGVAVDSPIGHCVGLEEVQRLEICVHSNRAQ